VVDELRRLGVGDGDQLGLALATSGGAGIAVDDHRIAIGPDDARSVVATIEAALRPRWVWWSNGTAAALIAAGIRVARCWDVAAVHRLLSGGWTATPPVMWARIHHLDRDTMPSTAPLDLFSVAEHELGEAGDPEDPVRADGHLRASWVSGGWSASPTRLARWAALALDTAARQQVALDELPDPRRAAATARSESAAELLCAELAADGLPIDRDAAEAVIAGFVGPRPTTPADAEAERRRRDDEVLRHVPPDAAIGVDLRSPGQVKSLLRRVGIEVPDTRAWRLEGLRDAHPVVDPLLAWRKAERVETTYGYRWLDEHVGDDGRLRGEWSGSDGAAGRMTASAGLHNMPADLRGGVIAEAGHVFVRADLGQIEPRVLAVVSGDAALAKATSDDDLYLPIAAQLDVDRPTAKVAMLGAMYGQTTGRGAEVQHRLRSAYPVAMTYLEDADRAGQVGRSIRTYGGRLIRFGSMNHAGLGEREARGRAAAMGRYGRNAMVQGAAAELFKVWAVTVRARGAPLDARIVLCLHDELLIHTPVETGDAVASLVDDCLAEAAHRWSTGAPVRFVADISVIRCWKDAKDPGPTT
jgi:DNA polymerase-1